MPLPDPPASTDAIGNTQVVTGQATDLPPSSESIPLTSEGSGSFEVRVATGPLASRSAGPLGPLLATVVADPAPPVDRHERAFSQTLDDRESDDNEGTAARRPELTSVELAPIALAGEPTCRTEPADETLVAVAGLGAFPLKVTAIGGIGGDAHRADLAALLGTLPGSLDREDCPALIAETNRASEDVSVALAMPLLSSPEAREAPDYLTAACGLALGLRLWSGPLIPDLLALAQSRRLPWRRALPASMTGGRAPVSLKSQVGGNRGWLRGPLSSWLRGETQ
jgi:hypothetical protein